MPPQNSHVSIVLLVIHSIMTRPLTMLLYIEPCELCHQCQPPLPAAVNATAITMHEMRAVLGNEQWPSLAVNAHLRPRPNWCIQYLLISGGTCSILDLSCTCAAKEWSLCFLEWFRAVNICFCPSALLKSQFNSLYHHVVEDRFLNMQSRAQGLRLNSSSQVQHCTSCTCMHQLTPNPSLNSPNPKSMRWYLQMRTLHRILKILLCERLVIFRGAPRLVQPVRCANRLVFSRSWSRHGLVISRLHSRKANCNLLANFHSKYVR